nr:laccase-5-like [Osmia lignaria]
MNSIQEALLYSLLILAVVGKNVAANIKAGYIPGFCGMPNIDEQNCMNEELFADSYLSNPLECARTCQEGETRTCYYKFVLERYPINGVACSLCTPNITNTLCANCQCILGDGVERMALTVNRMIPGPSVQVCQGDYVVVDVLNNINSEAVTIHWHGIQQQGSPHQDGVPNLTQCPIIYKNAYRYQFFANTGGTHFWHAHTGAQKMDGIFGSFVVRETEKQDVHSHLYDFDLANHVMLVNDWFTEETTSRYPGRKIGVKQHLPESFFINGKGRYTNPYGVTTNVPLEVITVEAGHRYRFRFINSICTVCGVQLTIEKHKLTVISSDGQSVEPVVVDSIVSFAGERYDFVLNATESSGAYWIQLRGIGECTDVKIQQLAILQYVSGSTTPASREPTYDYPLREGLILNPMDFDCKNKVCVSDLKHALKIDSDILQEKPDVKLVIPIGVVNHSPEEFFKPNEYKNFLVARPDVVVTETLNNISLSLPPSPPLSQLSDVSGSEICNADNMPTDCGSTVCTCTHVIKVPLHSVVEIVVVDEFRAAEVQHSFHMHGYAFHVVSVGQPLGSFSDNTRAMTVKLFNQLEEYNQVKRNFNAPPSKDTFAIPNNGYAILRFKADNPGFWMFHCHQMFHILVGMELVIQVGEPKDFPETPKDFPKCGNYIPKVEVRNQKNNRARKYF